MFSRYNSQDPVTTRTICCVFDHDEDTRVVEKVTFLFFRCIICRSFECASPSLIMNVNAYIHSIACVYRETIRTCLTSIAASFDSLVVIFAKKKKKKELGHLAKKSLSMIKC